MGNLGDDADVAALKTLLMKRARGVVTGDIDISKAWSQLLKYAQGLFSDNFDTDKMKKRLLEGAKGLLGGDSEKTTREGLTDLMWGTYVHHMMDMII